VPSSFNFISSPEREIELRSRQRNLRITECTFRTNFPTLKLNFSWVTQSRHRELPGKLPRFCAAGSELCRSLANFIRTNSSPIHQFFLRFDPDGVPPRSLPIVPEHRELVGLLTIELTQRMPIFMALTPIRDRSYPVSYPADFACGFPVKDGQNPLVSLRYRRITTRSCQLTKICRNAHRRCIRLTSMDGTNR
jgi:hypothetical protein